MHIDNVIFLILSKNAYTKFSAGPFWLAEVGLYTTFRLICNKPLRNNAFLHLGQAATEDKICLAISFYEQIGRLRNHLVPILAGVLAGVLCSAGSIYLLAKLFALLRHGLGIEDLGLASKTDDPA